MSEQEIQTERERESEERVCVCWVKESFKRKHAEIGICEFVRYCILHGEMRWGRLRQSSDRQTQLRRRKNGF
jgi:hypothetical protein